MKAQNVVHGVLVKRISILVTFLAIIAAISLETSCSHNVEENKIVESSQYRSVTVSELTGNTTDYDGQKITVKGLYVSGPWPVPACMPTGTGANPVIREEYQFSRTPWAISGLDGIGLVGVTLSQGATIPEWKYHQEIELRGIARAGTIEDYCNRDVRYRTTTLEINPVENGFELSTKPPPPAFPTIPTK